MSANVTIVVPTFQREEVLLETLGALFQLKGQASEVIVVDQTSAHTSQVSRTLRNWHLSKKIRWVRLTSPSITRAMNTGLVEATHSTVLFLDDDIIPVAGLVNAHVEAMERTGAGVVAGRVLQPWHLNGFIWKTDGSQFVSTEPKWVREFMGGNFSIRRDVAIDIGGFDENFVRVAYNFEAEFSFRLQKAGHRIYYEPAASIRHLKVSSGGTRAYGDHLRSIKPDHAVGAYYYLLRTWSGPQSLAGLALRPLRAISTRHHLRQPWWIPATLLAELSGILWALVLVLQGPRYLSSKRSPTSTAPHD